MGGKQSSQARTRAYSNAGQNSDAATSNGGEVAVAGTSAAVYPRTRARSLGSAHNGQHADTHTGSPDSDSSTPDGTPLPMINLAYNRLIPSSLPVQFNRRHGKLVLV